MPDDTPADRLREMNQQTLNAHVRFEIAVQQALSRLSWELRQILMRAEASRKAPPAEPL